MKDFVVKDLMVTVLPVAQEKCDDELPHTPPAPECVPHTPLPEKCPDQHTPPPEKCPDPHTPAPDDQPEGRLLDSEFTALSEDLDRILDGS